jgi:Zinc-finger of mitochondrial splicing suppressor 51
LSQLREHLLPLSPMHTSSRHLLSTCIRRPPKSHIPLWPRCLPSRPFTFLSKNPLHDPSTPSPSASAEEKVPKHPLDAEPKYLRLTQDNLFHPLINSPIVSIRRKAMAIKSLAVCPTSGLLEGNEFTCPKCGFPTHCSEEHYKMDRARHERESCDTLRIINEDLHDVQSGRQFPEFTLKRTLPRKRWFC